MPITDLRRDTRAVIQAVQSDGEAVTITQHGRPVVVLIDYEQYTTLIRQQRGGVWPRHYFEQTYGALTDDPLVRPEQDTYPEREPIL